MLFTLRPGILLPRLILTEEILSGCFLSLEVPVQTQVGTPRVASTPWMGTPVKARGVAQGSHVPLPPLLPVKPPHLLALGVGPTFPFWLKTSRR